MSDTTEERSPRFSRAILGRIVAVLAFVGLGTFAVIQSVVGDRHTVAEASQEAPADTAAAAAEPLQQEQQPPVNLLENKLAVQSSFQPPVNPASTNQIAFSKPQSPLPATTAPQIKPFSPPQSTRTDDNTFSKPKTAVSTQPPPTNASTTNSLAGFEFKRPQTDSELSASTENRNDLEKSAATLPPIVVAKQATGNEKPLRSTFQPTQFPANQTPDTPRVTQMGAPSLSPGGSSSAADNPNPKTGDIARDATQPAVQNSNQSFQGLKSNFNSAINSAKGSLESVNQSNPADLDERPSQQSNSFMNKPAPAVQTSASPPPVSFNTAQGLRPVGQFSEAEGPPAEFLAKHELCRQQFSKPRSASYAAV